MKAESSNRVRGDMMPDCGGGTHHASNGQTSGLNLALFMKEVPLQSFTKRRMTADEAGSMTERANSSSHGNTIVPKKQRLIRKKE